MSADTRELACVKAIMVKDPESRVMSFGVGCA